MVVRSRLIQPLGIRGASLCRGGHHYVLRLADPYSLLSSAPLGEGFLESRWVLSLEVTPDADISCPQEYLLERAEGFGVPPDEPFIGLLTAVRHRDLQLCVRSEGGVTVATLVTAGVSNASSPRQRDIPLHPAATPIPPPLHPTAAPIPPPLHPAATPILPPSADGTSAGTVVPVTPGTINLVTLIDADLSPGALVRASTMVTEAKTLALVEAGVITRNGSVATGTSTDVTVVGHSGQGVRFDYAGSPTLVGWLVAATAHEAVSRGIAAYIKRKQADKQRETSTVTAS